MKAIKPGALLLVCIGFVALAAPAGIIIWTRANGFFFVHEVAGQPRDTPTGLVFGGLGVIAAVLYGLPAGLAFLALRRTRWAVRNAVTVGILVLALGVLCLRLTGYR